MKNIGALLLVLISLIFILSSCTRDLFHEKIKGLSLVSPPNKVDHKVFVDIKKTKSNWVAIIPYAFTPKTSNSVFYDQDWQWWGEKTNGVKKLIEFSALYDLKVMLKPHVWYGTSWIGDFYLSTEEDWLIWEENYTNYILNYAKIAETYKLDLLCIGTEMRQVILRRPLFFKNLILKIRKVYNGKLTYAANWDDYKLADFWDDLDYIGINAYFPLTNNKEPIVSELNDSWKPIKSELIQFHEKTNKQILFTEFGYESCDFNSKEPWGAQGNYKSNYLAQYNAYKSFFETFSHQKAFVGGFLWKWHLTRQTIVNKTKAFTPQGKKALNLYKQQQF